MLAYKKSGNDGYIEIEVDVTENGEPILPEDATVETPPEQKDGFYLTIENSEWTYVKSPEPPEPSIDELRYMKRILFTPWSEEFLNQPFIFDGKVYSNDGRFREMLNSAISAFREWGELPEFWVTADDEIISPVTKEFLDDLGKTAYKEHQKNLLTVVNIKKEIETESDFSMLDSLTFPEPETNDTLRTKLDSKK